MTKKAPNGLGAAAAAAAAAALGLALVFGAAAVEAQRGTYGNG